MADLLSMASTEELEQAILDAVSWASNEGDHESYKAAVAALAELVRRVNGSMSP